MGSRFLSSGNQTLTDGTANINIQSAIIQDLLPNLPVRTTVGKKITSGLIQLSDCAFTPLSDPFNGTLHVQDLVTAYNTTPVDLNSFIAGTLTNLSTLNSETQYLSATPGLTTIASNLATNDIKAQQYQDPTGSTFIDMTTPGEINIAATTFDFNGVPVATTASLGAYLKLDGTTTMTGALNMGNQNINNVNDIIPDLAIGSNLGSNSLPFDTMYISGSINGASNVLIGPGSSTGSYNIATVGNTNGTAHSILIGDASTVNIRNIGDCDLGTAGDPFTNCFLAGNLDGETYSRAVDNILSCSTAQTAGNLLAFDTFQKVTVDSGISGSSLTGGPFVPRSGVTGMLGNLDINAFNLLNVAKMTTSSASGDVIIGNGAATDNTAGSIAIGIGCTGTLDGIAIGQNCIASFASTCIGQNCTSANAADVCIGFNAASTLVAVGNSVCVGNSTICNNGRGVAVGDHAIAGGHSISIGYASSANSTNAIAIGGIAGATGSISLGESTNNSIAHSCLIGDTININIRPNNNNVCDLGATGSQFNNIWSGGSLTNTTGSVSVNNLITTNTNGPYLPLSGVTGMAGNLQMNTNNITNVGTITTATSTVNIGSSNTTSGAGSISVGGSNTAGGSGGGKSIIYGNNNNTSGSTNGQCIIYGNDNTDANGAGGAFIYGFSNSNSTGQRNILIGRNNTVTAGINDAVAIGFNQTNSTTSSLLVGAGTNWRPSTNNTCDLGVSSTNQFNNIFVNNVSSTGAITVAGSLATSLGLGRAGITTTANGTFTCQDAYGAWYSNVTAYLPTFTAGTARLIPPTASTSGPLSLFTQVTPGILTYTGTRSRIMKISYTVSISTGVNTVLTLYNSINGSTVLSTSQTTAKHSDTTGVGSVITISFTDIVNMNTNDTMQLCANNSVSTATVSFNNVSCNVLAMLN